MRRTLISMAVLPVGVFMSACVSGDSSEPAAVPGCTKVQPAGFPTTTEGVYIGETAPDLAMVDMDGNDVCLRDYTGKVVLINSAAGWCGPCKDETPGLQNVYEQYKDQGFVILMGMLDDYNPGQGITDDGFLAQWQQTYGITFPLINDSDPVGAVYTTYVRPDDPYYNSIPATIIVDRDHVVRYNQVGGISESSVRSIVNTWVTKDASLVYE